jgi:hypothetical protein
VKGFSPKKRERNLVKNKYFGVINTTYDTNAHHMQAAIWKFRE